ncbi:hypothetical protein ABPG75_011882 [Micractinium tetrahymenae]
MGGLLFLLLLSGLLVAAAASWKRLLGLAVSRFAHGRAFRLTVGEFFFAGLADVRLQLHVGPVREVRVARLSLRFATANSGDGNGSGGPPWQALLSGQLLLPISLQGVSVRLAPAPPKPQIDSQLPAEGPPAMPPRTQPAAAPGRSSAAGSGSSGRKSRSLRGPLAVLAHLPLRVEGLTVLDEERSLQVQLQLVSISLHGVQQLLLGGLAVGLALSSAADGSSSGSSSGGGGNDGSVAGSPRKAPPGSPTKRQGSCSLQRVLVDLGAVSLSVSKPLLLWAQQQQQQAAAARLRRLERKQPVAPDAVQRQPGSADKQQRLLSVLSLLPKECELSAESCSIASGAGSCAGSSSGSAGGDSEEPGLPLAAAFSLHGVRLRLGKAAPDEPAGSGAGSAAEADCLMSIAAGWQKLGIRLGAAGGTAAGAGADGRGRPLPSALAISSGTAEWSLDLLQPAAAAASSSGGSSDQPALRQLSAIGQVSIGALHTDVCHPAVQPLLARLREAAVAAKSALQPALPAAAAAPNGPSATHSTAELPASSSSIPALEVPAEQQQLQQQLQQQRAGQPKRPAVPLLGAWQATVRLGDGSRLLFTDAAGRCCWSSGLASCRLAVRGGGSSGSSSEAPLQAQPVASISGSFEVEGIEMYAVATAIGSTPGEQPAAASAGPSQPQPPPQMLSAQLRVEVEHVLSARRQAAQQQASQPEQLRVPEEQPPSGSTAVDATTSGVHLLVQQQQLATVASVIVSLLPPAQEAEHPPTPEETAAAADSLLQAASRAAVAAAAAAVAPPARRKRRLQLSFACSDTLLLLPTVVTAPAEHCSTGQLLLLPAAPALLLSSVSGRLGGAPGGSKAHAEGCSLLYCEGAASQRFPSSSVALKEQAKAAVLTIDSAEFRQAGGSAAGDSLGGMQLEIGAVAAAADADALLCLVAVADSAAHQVAAVLAAAPPRSLSPRSRRRGTDQAHPSQQRHLSVSLGSLRLAQPLCAGRDMALEVAAVHAMLGAQQGCRHSVSTAGAVLTVDDKPVLRWRHLAASLALPEPAAGRLAARPLPPALAPSPVAQQAQQAGPGGSLGFEAYHRARLQAWLDADAATAPARASRASSNDAAAAALGAGPASILDATVSGAELIVPHNCEPGPSERYLELYLKALETAMQQHLQRLQQLKQRRKAAAAAAAAGGAAGEPALSGEPPPGVEPQRRRSLFPMQINLAADDVALRFEHHPLESWLASRGPLLQQMAVQQHLWGEVAAAVQPADAASPLHAAMVESAFASVACATQQAWDGLMQDLLQLYRTKLSRLEGGGQGGAAPGPGGTAGGLGSGTAGSSGCGSSGGGGKPDLMRLACSRLCGLAVLCAGGPEARAAAQAQVVAADPASAGVPMSKMLKLHADVGLDDFEMRLAGASAPFVGAAGVRLSGTAAIARQATAPPQTAERRLPVGAHRSVPIPVTVKGSRPVFKFYTDLQMEAEALSVCHSQGLEPALALVSLAGKRLSPGDPDKTVPRPPPIPWWDDLRYTWRGPLALSVRQFDLTLAGTEHPDVTETSERMAVEARDLTGRVLSGEYELGMADLRVTLHRSAGVQQLGGTLLALPFVHAPRTAVRLSVDWKLPGGRSPDDHHLFPRDPPPAGALQGPVYAGVLYKAESMDLALAVELGGLGSAPGEAQPAAGFLGGHQVQWMKQYVALVNKMSPQIRQVNRRGTFFWRKPPPGPGPRKGIGKLIQQLSLTITAAPLEIVHLAADPADCSHGISLRAPSCTYTAAYLLNQPVPSFLRLPPHARKSKRPDPTPSLSLNMDVQAGSVTVHKAAAADPLGEGGGSSTLPGTLRPAGGFGRLRRAGGSGGSGMAAFSASAGASPVAGALLGAAADLIAPAPPPREQQPIITAGTVAVTQDALIPGGSSAAEHADLVDQLAAALGPQGSRPLRVLISDCRVMVDAASRDAVWAAVEHLISAFTSSGEKQRRNLSDAPLAFPMSASPSPTLILSSPSMPWSSQSPAAQLQRHMSQFRGTPTPTHDASAHREAAAAAADAATPGPASGGATHVQQAARPAGAAGTPLAAQPSGDSSNELLTLLLQQQAAARGRAADGSPALLHPGVEGGEEADDDDEDIEAPLSSPADDQHGQLRYVVEVADLQINVESENAQGRLLLAARSGRLQGLHIADSGLNVTALLMEQVSAYVTKADVDPDAPVLWMAPTPTGYQMPQLGQGLLPISQWRATPCSPVCSTWPLACRRIFDPILISLRHSKVASGANPRRRSAMGSRGSRSSRHRSPGSVFGGSLRGEELSLRVPEIPEVVASLNSREFEVLVEVITMLQSPGPTVETVGAEAALLAELEGEEVEEARRLYALLRQQLWELRSASLALRASLGLQRFTSQLAPPAGAGGCAVAPLEVAHFLAADSADFVSVQFATAAELAVAMREHLAAASAAAAAVEGSIGEAGPGSSGEGGSGTLSPLGAPRTPLASASPAQLAAQHRRRLEEQLEAAAKQEGAPGAGSSGGSSGAASVVAAVAAEAAQARLGERQREQAHALLLRWVEEQEGGACEALEKAKSSLLSHKAIARKRQQKHSASRVLLQADHILWRMCTPAHDFFTQISIRRLILDKFKQKDHSGFAKFSIHRIEVLDTQGVLGPGPGIGAGVILSVWNPDASWERDDMLRVVATMGVPTQTHIVYDHLDVILHPIAFHLTEQLAVGFWEYFFPREDEAKARAAAAFARSVAVPAAAAARHRRSATALPDLGSSHQGSPVAGSPMRRQLVAALAGETGAEPTGSQPGSGRQSPLEAGTPRASGIVNAGWRSAPTKQNRHSTSATTEASLSRQGTFGSTAGAAAAAAAADAALLATAAETAAALATAGALARPGGLAAFQQRAALVGPPGLERTSSSALGAGRLYRPLSSVSLASEDSARPSAPAHCKVRFVHVKINRAHCRATYEGYPLTFNDLKLVIDNRTYANIEGRWRDLFNKMKWDTVKSVVKSVAGLQGRKFKELLPEGFPGDGDGEGGSRRKLGLLQQLKELGKGRKDGSSAAAGEPGLSEEELRAQHKRRMLFGQAHPRSTASTPAATPAAAPALAAAAAAGAAVAAAAVARGSSSSGQEGAGGVSPRAAAAAGAAAAAAVATAASDLAPLGAASSALRGTQAAGRSRDASSGPSSPARQSVDEVAAAGEVFAPPPAAAGPLGQGLASDSLGPFGSSNTLLLEHEPSDPGPGQAAGGAPGAATAEAAVPRPMPQPPWPASAPAPAAAATGASGTAGGSGRTHLSTPRWAKQLASKAQKGLHKLRDSLQD